MGDEPGPTGLSAVHKLPASVPPPSVLGAESGHCSKMGNRKGLLCSGRRSCFSAGGAYVSCASLQLAEDLHLVLTDSDQTESDFYY